MRRLARLLATATLVLPLVGLAWTSISSPGEAFHRTPVAGRHGDPGTGSAVTIAPLVRPAVAAPLVRAAANRATLEATSPQRWQPWATPLAVAALGGLLALVLSPLGLAGRWRRAPRAWCPGWLPAERAPPLPA